MDVAKTVFVVEVEDRLDVENSSGAGSSSIGPKRNDRRVPGQVAREEVGWEVIGAGKRVRRMVRRVMRGCAGCMVGGRVWIEFWG